MNAEAQTTGGNMSRQEQDEYTAHMNAIEARILRHLESTRQAFEALGARVPSPQAVAEPISADHAQAAIEEFCLADTASA